jgi:hypothetical protein
MGTGPPKEPRRLKFVVAVGKAAGPPRLDFLNVVVEAHQSPDQLFQCSRSVAVREESAARSDPGTGSVRLTQP